MHIDRVEVACLSKIADAVEVNLSNYLERDDYWLGEFLEGLGFELKKGMLIEDLDLKVDVANPAKSDAINAERLHSSLELSPELAGNGLFWTILSHHQSSFIIDRLGLNSNDPKLKDKIRSNFVFKETMTKRERRSGVLPRLWTIADLTYDRENTPNPYHLTDLAFRDLDLTIQILDRSIFMNSTLVHAFMKRYDVRLENRAPMSRGECRSIFKNLHALSRTIVLEYLSEEELTDEIVKFEKWYKSHGERYGEASALLPAIILQA